MSMKNHINLKAPGNWINDPNGFIYYGGKYHLFYQYFPYGPFWGTMHWGHAISDDLVDWEHLGIALMPTKEYDRNGVFSGSAIEKNGKMYLYYTGVVYASENPENIHISKDPSFQCQVMIISDDGMHFDNFNNKKQIIPVIYDKEIADPNDCRDPKVWKIGDAYYMCLASTNKGKRGVLVLFKSEDAVNWTYFNRLESDAFGSVLECPDLFKVNDRWLLICSPCGNNKDGAGHDNQAIIQPVIFNPENGELSIDGEFRFFDYGFDLYAPQSNLDEDGNRVVMSWARMECPMKPVDNPAAGDVIWNGMMAIPRVIEVHEGEVYIIPHARIREYFLSEKCQCEIDGKITRRFDDTKCQITARIIEGEEIDINGYKISLSEGRIVGDRSRLVPKGLNIQEKSFTPYIGNETNLEIYYDSDLIEIFADNCKYSISHVTYINAVIK